MRSFHLTCLFLILAAHAACTGFTDVSSLEPEEEACTVNVDTACPAGTAKKSFDDLATYGVCDEGTGSRYLRDLSQASVGYCNGTSSACGYICTKDATQTVCNGAGTCAPGFNPVSTENLSTELARVTEGKTPVTNTSCQNGKIFDEQGGAVASCELKDGCTYYCVREFTFACGCGADELGVCLPCGCSATSLVCADGSCVELAELRVGVCQQNPQAPCTEEIDATIACVWSQSIPPATCTEAGLSQFQPSDTALSNCIPSEHLFTCNNGQTIPEYNQCDGTPNCFDNSDETNCVVVGDFFDCGDGGTIPFHQFCNGSQDCSNGADEAAESGCAAGDLFNCGGGQSIPMFLLCDGNPDCFNQTDETADTCGINPVDCHPRDNHLPCKVNNVTECLDTSVLCDGDLDCDDGSDEANVFCDFPGEFSCNDGTSVPITSLCDGIEQCGAGQDENGPLCAIVNGSQ